MFHRCHTLPHPAVCYLCKRRALARRFSLAPVFHPERSEGSALTGSVSTSTVRSQTSKPSNLQTCQHLSPNSFRIRTSAKHTRNPFGIRSFKTKHLKPFRIHIYEKTRGARVVIQRVVWDGRNFTGSAVRPLSPKLFRQTRFPSSSSRSGRRLTMAANAS